MPNLAALIREAERMRPSGRDAKPEEGKTKGDLGDSSNSAVPSAKEASTPPSPEDHELELPISSSSLSSPGAPGEAQEVSVHLTEEQLESLRNSLATPPEVMTLSEAASYLRVSRNSIIDLVREQNLPATKLAGKWRFKRTAVDHWMELQLNHYPRNNRQ
jgi:excisionase family DNA binding protein